MPIARHRNVRRLLVAALTGAALLPMTSLASLGDTPASIEADRVHFSGTVEVTHAATYEMHDITTSAGQVREYLAGGRVFAVGWHGQSMPDLAQLLGQYHPTYTSLVKPQPGNHHVVAVDGADLSIRVQKLPRGFIGRVFVPSLAPAGLTVSTLP